MTVFGLASTCDQLDLWLVAERQTMSGPAALTKYLTTKDDMMRSLAMGISDLANLSVNKSQAHMGNCDRLIEEASAAQNVNDRDKKLGTLASKALKVASGYEMKAGYFLPDQPQTIYTDTMIRLKNYSGAPRTPLGQSVSRLMMSTSGPFPDSMGGIGELLAGGREAAHLTDQRLQTLMTARLDDLASTSTRYYDRASDLGVNTKALYAKVAIASIILQGEGLEGHGPLILEPLSDANANSFLRVGTMSLAGNPPEMTSEYPVPR